MEQAEHPKPTGDYFGLSQRDTVAASDRRRRTYYVAAIKHALLFTPRLLFADHMIVNAPNFRHAYQGDRALLELFDRQLIEIAHFEKHKDGTHMTLPELREFYRDGQGPFHRNMATRFQTDKYDHELRAIEAAARHYFVPSENRDPLFTQYCLEVLEDGRLKRLLGDAYTSYKVAHGHMCERYPILGIIHFDSEHTFVGDDNIFDYMARLNGMRLSKHELIARFGAQIAGIYRALLVKAETQLLGVETILPADLLDYRTFVLNTADRRKLDTGELEEQEIDIDLSAVSENALAVLSTREILDLRTSDEGSKFFEMLGAVRRGEEDFSELRATVCSLCDLLNSRLSRIHVRKPAARTTRSVIRIIRGTFLDSHGRKIGVGLVLDILGLISQSLFFFNPAAAAKAGAEKLDEKIGAGARDMRITDDIKASFLEYGRGNRITQYR